MKQAIIDFVAGKRIAVVGVSRNGHKFGNNAVKELSAKGYEIFIVHPEAKTIDGMVCYPNLASLKGKIDGVLVVVPPAKAIGVLEDAAVIGVKNVWLQLGTTSNAVIARGRALNLNLVENKCILMYAAPVIGFHNFHRNIVRFFGRL